MMAYNSVAETHGAYKNTRIEVFIESSHTEQMLQMYQTVLQHFDLGTCLYHRTTIKQRYHTIVYSWLFSWHKLLRS